MLCDVHNHLLPGIDDGSRSMQETLHHLGRFHAQGVDDLVLTPHLLVPRLDAAVLEEALALHRGRFAQLAERVGSRTDVPELHLGQEILVPRPEDVERVVGRSDVGMAGGRTLLVEFGFGPGFEAEAVIRRILAEGRSVIVAHAERYAYGHADPVEVVRGWRDLGAHVQVNGGSLAGLYTEAAGALGWRLLAEGVADLVATDHHGDHRPHDPLWTAVALDAELDPGSAERLMGAGPRRAVGIRERTGRTARGGRPAA